MGLFLNVWALVWTLWLAGCSSIPDFRPSKPLEEASSPNEALELCAGYQIRGEESRAGQAQLARVPVLMPWINCFESVLRRFPEARANEEFVFFFRALRARHDAVHPPAAQVVDWPEMNFAVRQIVEHLRRRDLRYSEREIAAIQRQFPGFSIYLSEVGRFTPSKPSKGSRASSGALGGALTRGSSRPDTPDTNDRPSEDLERLPPRPLPLSAAQKEYCKKYLKYRSLRSNAEELEAYKRILEEQTYQDTSNTNEAAMKKRVNERYEALKTEAAAQGRLLAVELKAIEAKSAWFRNGYCLEKAGYLAPLAPLRTK